MSAPGFIIQTVPTQFTTPGQPNPQQPKGKQMSHEFDSGFTVRTPAWHGLSTVLPDHPDNADEARRAAGLLWEPRKVPMFVRAGDDYLPVSGHSVVERDDNHAVLATASDSYELITNAQTFELAEALFDTAVNIKYETAGALKEGRLVYALLKLDESFEVPGDPFGKTMPYVAVTNAHDGSAALRAIFTQVRIVCWNTWQAAERDGEVYTFRHTAKVHERLAEAKDVVASMRSGAHVYTAFMERLIGIPFDERKVKMFLAEFVPTPPAEILSDRVVANVEEARDQIRTILNSQTVPEEVRGTAYGVVQASGEYLDHIRGWRNQETYFGRTMLRKEPLKAKAAKLALSIAAS